MLTEWLVLTAQSGDEAAFRELHDLWRADLWRFARSRLGAPDGVDETTNDTWLAIARGLSRLEDPACFPRWAFRIAERRIADRIRRSSRERRRDLDLNREAERVAPAAPSGAGVSDDVARVREALGRLSEDQQQLMRLYYEFERTVAEIAVVLAIPVGTVKSRLFSARESLKQLLERENP